MLRKKTYNHGPRVFSCMSAQVRLLIYPPGMPDMNFLEQFTVRMLYFQFWWIIFFRVGFLRSNFIFSIPKTDDITEDNFRKSVTLILPEQCGSHWDCQLVFTVVAMDTLLLVTYRVETQCVYRLFWLEVISNLKTVKYNFFDK